MRQAVVYAQVSTGKQARSGLGLADQSETIARFAAAEGYDVVAEFVNEASDVSFPIHRSSHARSSTTMTRR